MAEFHRVRITTVFAADAELDVRAGLAALGDGDLHELANAGAVERGEGVLLEDFRFGVGHEEGAHVVAADAESGLGEVVGAEAEELGALGNLVGGERTARDFDHGADLVFKLHLFLRHHFLGDAMDDFRLEIEFLLEADERDHHLGFHRDLFLRDIGGGFEDGACLHLGDFRIGDAEAAAAVAEHRVELVEFGDALDDLLDADADFLREVELLLLGVGQELVKRRIEEADGGREALEGLEDAGEVLTLIRQELGESRTACLFGGGEDHLAHRVDAVTFEEHVFGAGEADAGGTEGHRDAGLLGGVGIGADAELGDLRAPLHELEEALELLGLASGLVVADDAGDDFRRSGLELSAVDRAGGAVDGKVVTFLELLTSGGDGEFLVIDLDGRGTADADLAHLAGNECRVRRDTTLGGEDALGSDHAAKVFRAGFVADEQDLFTFRFGGGRAIGVEVNFAGGSTRAGGKAGGDGLGFLHIGRVEDRREKLVELFGRVAEHGGLPVDELLLDHVHGELQRGGGGALAVAGLEHEQLAVLHGELDILHILEVFFEDRADLHEFGVRLRHLLLHVDDRLRGADAGDHIFALGVDEELTVEFVGAVGGVAGEGDARAGLVASVAVDHCLDIDGGAPLGGDVVLAAINDRAVIHP